jgi:hypothetical protein
MTPNDTRVGSRERERQCCLDWTSEGAGRKEQLDFSMSLHLRLQHQHGRVASCSTDRITNASQQSSLQRLNAAGVPLDCSGAAKVVYTLHLSSLTHSPAHVTLIAPPCHACS